MLWGWIAKHVFWFSRRNTRFSTRWTRARLVWSDYIFEGNPSSFTTNTFTIELAHYNCVLRFDWFAIVVAKYRIEKSICQVIFLITPRLCVIFVPGAFSSHKIMIIDYFVTTFKIKKWVPECTLVITITRYICAMPISCEHKFCAVWAWIISHQQTYIRLFIPVPSNLVDEI